MQRKVYRCSPKAHSSYLVLTLKAKKILIFTIGAKYWETMFKIGWGTSKGTRN